MVVYASYPSHANAYNTKVRNFKFKTEDNDAAGWQVIDGTDCYGACGGKGGKCAHCGTSGYCCSKNKFDLNGDCTEQMSQTIRQCLKKKI